MAGTREARHGGVLVAQEQEQVQVRRREEEEQEQEQEQEQDLSFAHQEGGSEEDEDDVMRRQLLALSEALALPHDEGGGETGDARADVHDVSSCEVEHADLGPHEAAAPLPVSDGAVDEDVPDRDENQHRTEAHALSEGAGDDGGGDDGKGELEEDVDSLRDRSRQGVRLEPRQPHPRGPSVEGVARGEGERVSEREPPERDEAGDGEALDHR
eukprot:758711-Hanusia_phi.AAC.1